MAAIFESVIIWQPDDYLLFKKCGELTISPDIQNIGFNCFFCTGICLQAEIFLQHLQEQHKEEIFKMYENQNGIILGAQDSLANNFNTELMADVSDVNFNENLNNSLITANNAGINSNQPLQSKRNQELKENCTNLNVSMATEGNLAITPDLNLVYNIETNDLMTISQPNQDIENLITLKTYENNCSSTLASNTVMPTFAIASILKCLPDDNACEIGDGEDSGIMLEQSPCHSDCGGLNSCMLFTEDCNSKSAHPNSTTNLQQSEDYNNNEECFKGKYIKTLAARKVLNNKELVKYLLEAYRKNEKLWNPKHSSYKYNAHRTMYNELAQPLWNDKKCSLTGEEIFGIIAELRGRYRRELKKVEMRKGKHKPRLWYFEEMEFLRDVILENRKERKKENDVNNELTNREILCYILELYRRNECLWNPKHKDYATCNKAVLHNEMVQQLKSTLNIEMTSTECLNEIQKLRVRYRKELVKLHKLKQRYVPKLWCFDEMEFLRSALEEKITKNLKKTNNRTLCSLSGRKQHFLKADEIEFNNLEEQLKFIEIYRSFNSLWDVDHPDYRSACYRRKALNEMLEKINLTFTRSDEKKYKFDQLEKTIYLLRKGFSREKCLRLTKSDLSKESVMSFVLYEKLSEFLSINLGPFSCDNCQRICKTYDQFRIHKFKHDGILPFICTLCGKGFQLPGNLTIHIRRHRRDFPYSCEICKKAFATSTEVGIHLRTHTGDRPYACEWCKKTFKTWSFYDIHRRTHLNESNFHCPICDKPFYERNRFTDHMNIHLNIRKHQCNQCAKAFTTVDNLKKHLDLHASVKKHKCQPCGKSFAQLASLRWHRKTHHEQQN